MGEQAAYRRSGVAQPAVELQGEQHVGEFGPGVGAAGGVAAFGGEVVGVEVADAVEAGADGDHDRVASRAQPVQEPGGEGEVAEVVGCQLALGALRAEPPRHIADAAVVDQCIDGDAVGAQGLGERVHVVEVEQVHVTDLKIGCRVLGDHLLTDVTGLLGVADRHDHSATVRGEVTGDRGAEAAAGAGDDERTAGLVFQVGEGPIHGVFHRISKTKRMAYPIEG